MSLILLDLGKQLISTILLLGMYIYIYIYYIYIDMHTVTLWVSQVAHCQKKQPYETVAIWHPLKMMCNALPFCSLQSNWSLYSANFWWRKPCQIWQITGGLPNFIIQILTMSCDIYEESKQAGIRQSFLRQKFVLYGICYHDVGKFTS